MSLVYQSPTYFVSTRKDRPFQDGLFIFDCSCL